MRLPSKLKPPVYNELHVNMVHFETDRTTELLKSIFYWPLMDDEINILLNRYVLVSKEKSPT